MKTVLHSYYFNTEIPEELEAYAALKKSLSSQGLECFETWGGKSHYLPELDGKTITLETEYLFNNQWNTAPIEEGKLGYRVFDWAEDYMPIGANKRIKKGHWLEQTEEMKAIRDNTLKCGYCGKQYAKVSAPVFCDACIDNQYLIEKDLRLLRLYPISTDVKQFPELNEEEQAFLLPRYRERQMFGITERGKARRAKEKADIERAYLKETRSAQRKHDGLLWLWEKGISLDNVIYYDHTDTFSFGWRKPLEPELENRMKELLEGFPFTYEFKKEKRY